MERLASSNREVFDAGLDPDVVRSLIRHALGETSDASVRVYVHRTDDGPVTVVTVRPPPRWRAPSGCEPSHTCGRNRASSTCTPTKGCIARPPNAPGSTMRCFTAADDRVSETTMANIGFFDEMGVVWPDAPMLDGITKQLLERHAADAGVRMRERPVHLAELASMTGAFVSSARGIGLVSMIDAVELDTPQARLDELAELYASVPWDEI